jgi:hypothetical protein
MWLAFAIVIGIPAVFIFAAVVNAAWHDRTDFNDGPETWGSQDIDQRATRR